jgi:DNA invertase Pin-like site-specific DNA recombinase
MMKRLYMSEAGGIVCWKLDRLARNPIDGASIIWAMKQHRLKVFTPSQSYSAEDENTILMYIEFGMAQKYIEDLSKNVRRGVRMKLEKGGWPAMAPLGYVNDRLNKTILQDRERFELVRKMWDMMLAGGHSIQEILEIANNEWGFRTRKWKRLGGRPLVKSAVYKVFTNPFYVGYLRHKQGLYKGCHVPMVTQEEFDRMQELLGRNDRPKSKRYDFPFAGGLIKCGECGCAITAEHKINRQGHHYVYYHCTKKKINASCRQASIEEKELEEQLFEFLKHLAIPKSLEDWILKYVAYVDDANKLLTDDKRTALNKALDENQKQIDELNRMRYRDYLSDDEFLREKSKLLHERNALQSRRERIDMNTSLLPLIGKTIRFAECAPQWFKQANPEHKRLIIETVGSNLVLKDKTLLIQEQIPFGFLNEAVLRPLVKNIGFEPQNLCLDKLKTASSAVSCSSWCAQMNDVRTFWEEHLDWVGKFEQIWKLFGDNIEVCNAY